MDLPKELIWQFKKFIKTNLKTAIVFMTTTVGFLIYGTCHHTQSSTNESLATLPPVTKNNTVQGVEVFHNKTQQDPSFSINFLSEFCDDRIRFNATGTISTGSAQENFNLELQDETHAVLAIGRSKIAFDLSIELSALAHKYCGDLKQQMSSQENKVYATAVNDFIINFFEKSQSLCKVSNNDSLGGLQCSIENISPWEAEKQLSNLQKYSIIHWGRQPYLMIRKMFMAFSLSKLLKEDHINPEDLSSFCSTVKNSNYLERPLILNSLTWINSFCSTGHRDTGLYGLSIALNEIEFLHELLNKQSLLGVIQIKIPNEVVDSKDFWIELNANKDVGMQMQSFIAEKFPDNSQMACWHPYMSLKPTITIARTINLIGQSALPCKILEEAGELNLEPEFSKMTDTDYFTYTISSNLQFEITNFRGKKIRLPKGSYSYRISPKSRDLMKMNDLDPDQSAEGQIDWTSRRPMIVIKEFKTNKT